MSVKCIAATVLLLQRLLTVWYPLWTLLFQPAIGVLMLGAVRPLIAYTYLMAVKSSHKHIVHLYSTP